MKKSYFAIGMMSGTSLDGLDICYAHFQDNNLGKWEFEIISAETISYTQEWENKLRNAFEFSAQDIYELNSEYGFYLGKQVEKFIQKYKIEQIDVIASHGHTIFHNPKKKYTVQIGDGRAIKIQNPYPVVYDFRSQDVLLGGNGAPLVPIGDQMLFSEYDACLNLGGFSNISMKKNKQRLAFDICPVNIVLNFFSEKLGEKYDENGELAKKGKIVEQELSLLNQLDFYQTPPPKSLGLEWVLSDILPILEHLSPTDALATFTEHVAVQLAKTFTEHDIKNVLVTGGGAFHQYLISKLLEKSATKIIIPQSEIIHYKEALIFGFMGVLRILGRNNVLSSATGSNNDHCSGVLIK